ncbi:MAG: hypothetical protein J6J66_02745 [Clostridia bacterium]|nr:hypothetical protein [Clostridia bacterium]
MKLSVDFSKTAGPIKAMHAVGQPPFLGMNFSYFHYLTEAHIPYSRLHDVGGAYGRNVFVDIPNIFRDFDADACDPASYDFTFTDALLSALTEAGVKPYFRLGVTIENYAKMKAYRVYPPKDFSKWARICEHIIRHYNEGWANGFAFGIEYWEIWNEPDSGPGDVSEMWLGTKEEYFALYKITAKHLKDTFGDKIKVGGYAACGLYAMRNGALEAEDKEALSYHEKRTLYWHGFFHSFMEMLKNDRPPMDFFSYHSYDTVENTLFYQSYIEKKLEEVGYGHVEIHNNEWNTHHEVDTMGTKAAAAHTAAMMCAMQKTKLHMLMYYDARIGCSFYSGMFDPRWRRPFVTYDAFLAFGTLYALGTEVEVKGAADGLYAVAATDGGDRAILLANIGEEREISLPLDGNYYAYAVTDDTRMKPVTLDPKGFTIEKEAFVLLTTKEIEIPQ